MVTFPGTQSFFQLTDSQHLEKAASKRDDKEVARRRLLLEKRAAGYYEGAFNGLVNLCARDF